MDYLKQPKWKATAGYTVNEEDGSARKQEDSACTLHFYLAKPGDLLHLIDKHYEYAVATYGFEIDNKYIYTYDYQQEENWAEYHQDLRENKFTQSDHVFPENCYFRVVIRRKENGQGADNAWKAGNSVDLFRILQWETETAQSKPRLRSWMDEHGKAELQREIKATVQEVRAVRGSDSLCFFLMTDSHYTVNGTWQDTMNNLYAVSEKLKEENIKLDGFLHLGDATDGLVPAEVTRDYVAAMQEDIKGLGLPLYYAVGNHDSNYFRNNPERFSKEETAGLYLRECDKCYYYMDYPDQRLRMVFLDSFDPAEKVRYGFSEEELDWLEEVLNQTMSDWYVLVCSHVPPTPRLHYWSKEIRGSHRLLGILRDFQSRTAETGKPRWEEGASENGNVSHGRLLGFIHGHNHADQVDYEEGFPIISIGCNKCEYFEDKKPQGAIACERELGAVSQDLWDVLAVSVKEGTLDFIRFGAGENRHISLEECKADSQDLCL